MLFKKHDPVSGKTLKTSRPLLISAAKGYVRPKETGSDWWLSTTTIWPVDELVGRRIRDWRRLSHETGHDGTRNESFRRDHQSIYTGSHSVFPIPLVEWIILRYGPRDGGTIVDAFAGGPPRGLVASAMGYNYVGFDVRQEQIDENLRILDGLGLSVGVTYVHGDGCRLDDYESNTFDMALTCPPYFDLEKYSEQQDDISNLGSYDDFNQQMYSCAQAHRRVMRPGSFVCLVVGPFRYKIGPRKGEIVPFVEDTIYNFRDVGFQFHQNIILSKNFASAAVRAANAWRNKKLVPRHEHLLVFRTP